MRLWQAFVASVLVHVVLLNLPVVMSSVREVECVEMRFIIESAPAATPASPQPANLPMHAAVRSAPETPSEAVKRPAIPRLPEPLNRKAPPRLKVNSLPKALLPTPTEPVPALKDERPADVSMPQPTEAAPAADPGGAPEASAGGNSAPQQAAVGGAYGAGHGVGSAAFGSSGGPGFIRRVLPRYPRLAREMGREGTVVLSLTIDEHGILQGVEVIERAGHGFDEEALRAMHASTFRAAVRNGRPVASRAILPIRFMLRGSGDD